MEKFTSLFFTETVGRFMPKRLIFEITAGEKSAHNNEMERSSTEYKTLLLDETKALKAADNNQIIQTATGKLNEYISSQKRILAARIASELDETKKKMLPTPEELEQALNPLRDAIQSKLITIGNDTIKKREENAKAWAGSMSVELTKNNRAKAETDQQLIEREPRMKDELARSLSSTFYTIYIEEGKTEAERIAAEWQKDPAKWKEALGDTYKTAEAIYDAYGFGSSPESKILGPKMKASLYEGLKQFGTEGDGPSTFGAYREYLKGASATIALAFPGDIAKQDAESKKLLTPTEWVADQATAHPEYHLSLKKATESREKAKNYEQLVLQVSDPAAQEHLRGVLDGIISAESDPKKQELSISNFIKGTGKSLSDIGSLTIADIQKVTKGNFDKYGDVIKSGVNATQDVDKKIQGFISGLQLSADPKIAPEYQKYIERVTQKESPEMRDISAHLNQYNDKITAFGAMANTDPAKAQAAIDARGFGLQALDMLRGKIKTPAAFQKDLEAEIAAAHPNHPEGAYVARYLLGGRTAENKAAYDIAEGALIASLHGKPEAEWAAILKQRMTDMQITTTDFSKATDYIKDKPEHKDKKSEPLDARSKGYISALAERAGKLPGATPASTAKYMDYVQKQQAALLDDPELKALVTTRDKKLIASLTDAQLDEIDRKIFVKTRALILPPDKYEAEQAKVAPVETDEVKKQNKDFLDKNSSLTQTKAREQLLAVFEAGRAKMATAPDAEKKAYDTKLAELVQLLDGTIKANLDQDVAKNQRLTILARAQDFVDSYPKPSTLRYEQIATHVGVTFDINFTSRMGAAPSKKYLEFAAGELKISKEDPKFIEAMKKIDEAKDDKSRAKAVADQMQLLLAASTYAEGKAKYFGYTAASFDQYNAYSETREKDLKQKNLEFLNTYHEASQSQAGTKAYIEAMFSKVIQSTSDPTQKDKLNTALAAALKDIDSIRQIRDPKEASIRRLIHLANIYDVTNGFPAQPSDRYSAEMQNYYTTYGIQLNSKTTQLAERFYNAHVAQLTKKNITDLRADSGYARGLDMIRNAKTPAERAEAIARAIEEIYKQPPASNYTAKYSEADFKFYNEYQPPAPQATPVTGGGDQTGGQGRRRPSGGRGTGGDQTGGGAGEPIAQGGGKGAKGRRGKRSVAEKNAPGATRRTPQAPAAADIAGDRPQSPQSDVEVGNGRPQVFEISGTRTWDKKNETTGNKLVPEYQAVDDQVRDVVATALNSGLNKNRPVLRDDQALWNPELTGKMTALKKMDLSSGTYEVDYGKKGKVKVTVAKDKSVSIDKSEYKG